MSLRDAWRALIGAGAESRALSEPVASGNGASPPAGLSTLPPWGGQWPWYGSRFLAENLPVVSACVSAIAGGIASLPMSVYGRDATGKRVERPDHPVARLLRRPNELQTGADFFEWLIASALLQGNAIAVIDHDGAGRPCGLYPIPWWACQPILVPAAPAEAIGSPIVPNSKLVFDVTMTMMPWPIAARPANGYPVRYFSDEVIFLRDRSDDGILGRSRLSRCPEALAAALGAQGFSSSVWTNGAMVGGVLKHPGALSKESADRIANSWRETHVGPAAAGRVAVLEEGMSFDRIGVSPEDAELLDSRRFSVEELCRVFNVPPPIIGEWTHATFSNTASAREWFAALTLLPWISKLEKEFSRVVFNTDDVQLCIDMSGMLRGDYPQLVASNTMLVRTGIMSADEARLSVNLDPRGGKADELVTSAAGGRPMGTEDGSGTDAPAGGLNGAGRNGAANGAGTMQ